MEVEKYLSGIILTHFGQEAEKGKKVLYASRLDEEFTNWIEVVGKTGETASDGATDLLIGRKGVSKLCKECAPEGVGSHCIMGDPSMWTKDSFDLLYYEQTNGELVSLVKTIGSVFFKHVNVTLEIVYPEESSRDTGFVEMCINAEVNEGAEVQLAAFRVNEDSCKMLNDRGIQDEFLEFLIYRLFFVTYLLMFSSTKKNVVTEMIVQEAMSDNLH